MNLIEKIIEWIRKFFRKTEIKETRQEISYSELKKLLKARFTDCDIYLSDRHYELIQIKELKAFLKIDKTNMWTYKKETRDCDDFSFGAHFRVKQFFPGACFGIVWSKSHAYNIAILRGDGKPEIYFVEPQTDRIFMVDYGGESYKNPCLIVI